MTTAAEGRIRRWAVVLLALVVVPAFPSDSYGAVRTAADATGQRPPQQISCSPPSSPPSSRSHFHIFATASGHSGPYNSCPQVGWLYVGSNGVDAPQWAYCRRWGGEVANGRGSWNHWWLWTVLDRPAGNRGWVSAYYIEGEGNDRADDIKTEKPIPNC